MGITIEGVQYLTIHETADFLGLEYSDVINLIHYHRVLNTLKLGGGRFVSLESAQAYLEKQKEKVAA